MYVARPLKRLLYFVMTLCVTFSQIEWNISIKEGKKQKLNEGNSILMHDQ